MLGKTQKKMFKQKKTKILNLQICLNENDFKIINCMQ
jgi:hypothetical protein